eukprot:2492759-Amphidinium_carterae.1
MDTQDSFHHSHWYSLPMESHHLELIGRQVPIMDCFFVCAELTKFRDGSSTHGRQKPPRILSW